MDHAFSSVRSSAVGHRSTLAERRMTHTSSIDGQPETFRAALAPRDECPGRERGYQSDSSRRSPSEQGVYVAAPIARDGSVAQMAQEERQDPLHFVAVLRRVSENVIVPSPVVVDSFH